MEINRDQTMKNWTKVHLLSVPVEATMRPTVNGADAGTALWRLSEDVVRPHILIQIKYKDLPAALILAARRSAQARYTSFPNTLERTDGGEK